MKYNPLIRDAVERNIEILKKEQPSSPQFIRATAIVEAYRHEEVIAMHDESVAVQREAIAVQERNTRIQKWLLIFTVILCFFTLVMLYFIVNQVH